MNCVCGHPERAHVLGGKCRVPDCPCERYQPGDTLDRARRWGTVAPAGATRPPHVLRGLVMLVLLAILVGPGPRSPVLAAEPPVPASFARLARAAQAASIMIREPAGDVVEAEPDEGATDSPNPLDALAARTERMLGAGVIVDPNGIALTSARAVLEDPEFEVAPTHQERRRFPDIGADAGPGHRCPDARPAGGRRPLTMTAEE